MKLRELLLTEEMPAPEKFKTKFVDNTYVAGFKIGNMKYIFIAGDAYLKDYDAWEVSFRANLELDDERPDTGVTGTGNVGKVFSTVIAIMKDFVKKKNPEMMIFSADDMNKGRVKLYGRFIRNVDKFFPGYVGRKEDEDFVLMRKDKV